MVDELCVVQTSLRHVSHNPIQLALKLKVDVAKLSAPEALGRLGHSAYEWISCTWRSTDIPVLTGRMTSCLVMQAAGDANETGAAIVVMPPTAAVRVACNELDFEPDSTGIEL